MLTVGVYSSNRRVLYSYHFNQYDDEIPKKCPSVFNTNKDAYSIINNTLIISISDERAWHLLQIMKRYFQNIVFQNIRRNFKKIAFCLLLLCCCRWNDILHVRWKGLMSSTRKWNLFSEKHHFQAFWPDFYSSIVIDGKMIVIMLALNIPYILIC